MLLLVGLMGAMLAGSFVLTTGGSDDSDDAEARGPGGDTTPDQAQSPDPETDETLSILDVALMPHDVPEVGAPDAGDAPPQDPDTDGGAAGIAADGLTDDDAAFLAELGLWSGEPGPADVALDDDIEDILNAWDETAPPDDGIGGPGQIATGSDLDDALTGTAFTDVLGGDDGADSIRGLDGDDSLVGGDGADTLWGEAGSDTLHGDEGDDRLSGGDGDDDLFGHDGADTLTGGAGQDALQGGLGDDALLGGLGDDALFGREGADTLVGGAGEDTLQAGDGSDVLSGLDDGPAQLDFLNGHAGDDTLVMDSADVATGGDGNDVYVLTNWIPESSDADLGAADPSDPADTGRITDFDGAEDRLVIVYDDTIGDPPVVSLQPSQTTEGATDVLLDGAVVTTVVGATAPTVDDIVLVSEADAAQHL